MFLFLCLKSSSKKRIQIQTAEHKAVSLRSLPLFRWAVPVSRSSFRSTDHLPPKKRAVPPKRKSGTALFLLSEFPVYTRSLPALVGATASATQTRKKNAGQFLRPPPLIVWAVALSPSHQPQ